MSAHLCWSRKSLQFTEGSECFKLYIFQLSGKCAHYFLDILVPHKVKEMKIKIKSSQKIQATCFFCINFSELCQCIYQLTRVRFIHFTK